MLPTINFDNQTGIATDKLIQKNDAPNSSSESGSTPVATTNQSSQDNDVKLSDFHPARARKLLNDRIISSMNSVLQSEGIAPLHESNADDFTPEKVAERILNFVDSAMKLAKLNGADDKELNNMLEEAKKGVDMGFEEAKEILEGFGVLNGKVAEDIDTTYDLIQKGFNEREFGKIEEPASDPIINNIISSQGERASASYSETFDLELKTKDGDIIKLSIASSEASYISHQRENDGSIAFEKLEYNTTSKSQMAYSVEGDIDEDEQKAIDELMNQIDEIADDFYSGKVRDAFKHAMELGYDSSEISSIAVNMTYSSSSAVSAYKNIDQISSEQTLGNQKQLSQPDIQTVSDYVKRIRNVLTAAETLFPEPKESVKELFEGVVKISERNRAFQQQVQEHNRNLISLGSLVSNIINRSQQVAPESSDIQVEEAQDTSSAE